MVTKNKIQFDRAMNEVSIMKKVSPYSHLMSICMNCCFYTKKGDEAEIYLIMDKKEGSLADLK
jgi:hypothetical protein